MVSNNHLVFRSSVFTHYKITAFLRHDALPPPTFFKTNQQTYATKKNNKLINAVGDGISR